MKVGIVTLYDLCNYGNRLQNYALTKVLENFGCEVSTLVFFDYVMPIDSLKRKKVEIFKNSNQKIKTEIVKKDLKSLNEKFDVFVVGRDQIWNPYARVKTKIKYLRFAEADKCVAYAPSFGLSTPPFFTRLQVKNGLRHIKYISVRENEGAKIVEKLTGKKVSVVLDPTMLLKKEDWQKYAEAKTCPKNYILTYFLGNTRKYSEKIAKIAEENNLEIINLNDKDSDFYLSSPENFVYLFENAKLVCTDSFHGSVFSIIFERPFVVFDRDDIQKNSNSRLNTLLKNLDLEKRKLSFLEKENYFEIDFSNANKRLENERKKSLEFLKNAIEKAGMKQK